MIATGRKAKTDLEFAYCCQTTGSNIGSCKVEAMVSIDERGQMVLPKELRDKVGIKTGDKLVLVSWKGGEICFISLVKTDDFIGMMKDMLGPMMSELTNAK